MSKYGAPSRTKYVIKVTNLSSRVSWQDLKDLFRKKGEVCYAEAHTERRNEGRVEMETLEDLERVMRRYQGYEVNGRRLELVEEIKKSRSRSKSRSSTRLHSETRSRSSTKRDSQSRSKSHSHSRTRSKSQDKEVDPDDQDIKRQRKRSYSGSSKHSRHESHSRPQSRQSQPASPARKTLRVAENDDDVEVNDTTDDKSDHET